MAPVVDEADMKPGSCMRALGTAGSSIEERWSPPLGGAMLAVSRPVNTSGKMVAFEYLRIVEREGGLVYIAQPGGAKPTEFTLAEVSPTRAVFDNPRHDYPKRIVYELSSEGGLSATIGFTKGGRRGGLSSSARETSGAGLFPRSMMRRVNWRRARGSPRASLRLTRRCRKGAMG